MTEPIDRELAVDIEAAVRAAPGVTGLFRVGGVISMVVDAGARAAGISGEGSSLARVERSADGLRVEVAIGVDAAAGSVGSSRRVHEAIDALCTARGLLPAEIHVTVVHVDDTSRATSAR